MSTTCVRSISEVEPNILIAMPGYFGIGSQPALNCYGIEGDKE